MSDLFDNPYIDIAANNHGGNKQSQDANLVIAPYKITWREKILGFMAMRDEQGLGTSCRHAADHFRKEAGQIGGRFTELKTLGLIEPTGITEDGYMVLRLTGSTKVSLPKTKRCVVTGNGLVAEIIVVKGTGGWQISQMPRKLEGLLTDVPLDQYGDVLTAHDYKYEWVKAT